MNCRLKNYSKLPHRLTIGLGGLILLLLGVLFLPAAIGQNTITDVANDVDNSQGDILLELRDEIRIMKQQVDGLVQASWTPPRNDPWTATHSGCPCYWEPRRFDCACCMPGGCQCTKEHKHQCVQCAVASGCGKDTDDIWTHRTTGGQCYWDKTRSDCPVCNYGGCQCDSTWKHQCVECGKGEDCGKPAYVENQC